MSTMDLTASRRLSTIVEIAVAAALATVVTAICVSASMRYGRLAVPASYDDVSYLLATQKWLNLLAAEPLVGPYELLNQHAPLMTLMAALGFLVFGPHDWAPYVVFGALLGVVAFATLRILTRNGLPIPGAILLVLCFALIPFFRFAVTEFRPDVFGGIITAFCILAVFDTPVFLSPPRRQFALGVLFGFALLIKPSAFLATGFVLTMAVLFSLIGFALQGMQIERPVLYLLRCFSRLILGVALVFLPYFAVRWRELLAYIEQTLFSSKEYWAFPGSTFDHLTLYATGYQGGGRALGLWFWIAMVTFAIRLLATSRYARRELPVLIAGYATLATIYAALSATPVKTYYLGSMFYATLTLFMLRDWACLVTRAPERIAGRRLHPAYAAIIAASALAVWFSDRNLLLTPMDELSVREVNQSTQAVSKMIHDRLPNDAPPFVLLANSPGPVRDMALGLEGLREGYDFEVHEGYLARTQEEFLALATNADLIVVTGSMEHALPGPPMGNAFQSVMRSDDRFKLVGTISAFAHPPVEVYERTGHNVNSASP